MFVAGLGSASGFFLATFSRTQSLTIYRFSLRQGHIGPLDVLFEYFRKSEMGVGGTRGDKKEDGLVYIPGTCAFGKSVRAFVCKEKNEQEETDIRCVSTCLNSLLRKLFFFFFFFFFSVWTSMSS